MIADKMLIFSCQFTPVNFLNNKFPWQLEIRQVASNGRWRKYMCDEFYMLRCLTRDVSTFPFFGVSPDLTMHSEKTRFFFVDQKHG